MTTVPRWASVDDDTADLLTVLADPSPVPNLSADVEWRIYTLALRTIAAQHDGAIPANALRPTVRGVVKPSRIGAFARRAQLEGLIVADGWSVSDDIGSRNGGKPVKAGYQTKGSTERMWIGTPAMQQPPQAKRTDLRIHARTRIAAQVKAARLTLDRQEADLLRTLAVGALESDEAQNFLSQIPAVGDLVPAARLAELEATLDLDGGAA